MMDKVKNPSNSDSHMKVGHSSLQASLSTFTIVSMFECECCDGLHMQERTVQGPKGNNDGYIVRNAKMICARYITSKIKLLNL
jgi:hypothetical protein